MDARERNWHERRLGKITSSCLSDLMTKGTKGSMWGKTAISYLYEKLYERRTGRPIRNSSNRNFEFGHTNEPLAIEWLRENLPYTIKHCSSDEDFPNGVVFCDDVIEGFGDSPDFYASDSVGGADNFHIVGEAKCLASQGKFEMISRSTRADVVDEYCEQFVGHFIGNPQCDKLLYICYDGNDENDEFDEASDLMASDRAVVFIYDRSEFEGRIAEVMERISEANAALNEAMVTGGKLERILNS